MRTRPTSIVVVVAFVTGLVLAACGSTSSDNATPATDSPGASTTTTTGPSSTTVAQADTAIWPFASGATRYADPVEAARSFAVTYLGFVQPVVGPFQQGDTRSGEVAIRSGASGPITTVLVRQLAPDDSWWVIGAATPNLQLQSPTTLSAIGSPVTLSGQSTAYEATVNVEIRQSGTLTPLTQTIVMGGSMGEMGPFSKVVTFPTPTAKAGAIVLKTMSAEDGTISEASVVAVTFTD